MSGFLSPGNFVMLASAPDWGIGQIQSVIGERVTVNFEHRGKQLINSASADLVSADPADTGRIARQVAGNPAR